MKRMMTVFLTVTLVAVSAVGAEARTYSIGRVTPDVVLEADPDYPYCVNDGEPEFPYLTHAGPAASVETSSERGQSASGRSSAGRLALFSLLLSLMWAR